MAQADVTWLRALKVFWSLSWRVTVYLAVPCTALSFLIFRAPNQLLPNLAGLPQAWSELPTALVIVGVLGAAGGIFLGTWLVKTVLGKAYSDFRIVLEAPPKRYKIEPRL